MRTGDITRDREKLARSEHAKYRTLQKSPPQWNPQTQGYRGLTIYHERGRRNPRWTYVKGRNEYRGKVAFAKDEFEDFVDTWAIMAKL